MSKAHKFSIFLLLESREVLFHTSCLKSSLIDKIVCDRFNLKYFNAYDTFCVLKKKDANGNDIENFSQCFLFWQVSIFEIDFFWTSYYAAIFGRYQKRLGVWHYFEERSRRKYEQQVSCAYYVYGIFNGI